MATFEEKRVVVGDSYWVEDAQGGNNVYTLVEAVEQEDYMVAVMDAGNSSLRRNVDLVSRAQTVQKYRAVRRRTPIIKMYIHARTAAHHGACLLKYLETVSNVSLPCLCARVYYSVATGRLVTRRTARATYILGLIPAFL